MSRVLNGLSVVKPDTREKVLRTADALGYRPSAIAQSFARGVSGNIGIVLPYLPKVHLFSTYYFAEICSGIGHALSNAGYHMLILFLQASEQALQLFQSRKVDGCILLGETSESTTVDALLAEQCPVCLVGQRAEHPSVITVDANHVEGARLATAHLIQKGHERIAFLNGPLSYSNSVDRLTGYKLALEEAGLAFHEGLLASGNYSRTSGVHRADAILAMQPQPTAVFAANDRMAAGLIAGLKGRGVEVGRHIALVGYDDGDTATIVDPLLTTVHVPFFEMGETAAALLTDRLEKLREGVDFETTPLRVELPTSLVVRNSCSRALENGRR